jgi:hypothetical protein
VYRFSGMGDGDIGMCSAWAGGYLKKACWCLAFPSLCSKDTYAASVMLHNPENIAPVQSPPVVGSPSGAPLTVPPSSGEVAQQTVDDLLAQQARDWQAQNAATIADTQGNLDRINESYDNATSSMGIPWYWWAVGGLGVFALVAAGSGSPRRYGR